MLALLGAAVLIGGKLLDAIFGPNESFQFTGSTRPKGSA